MKTITINLYSFSELSDEAKEKAIHNHINFIIETMDEQSYFYQYHKEMERMLTPWFLEQVIYEKAKKEVIEDIEINDYLFFVDGELPPAILTFEN